MPAFGSKLTLFFILAVIIALAGCSSGKSPQDMTAQEVYEKGVELFNDAEYTEAKKFFEVIQLQYPASRWADDAQYYIGRVHFQRSEYILAAFNFNRLRGNYPSSEYSQKSLFKTALCYWELSPTYDRDQEYTLKAIDAFNLFQRLYPDDSLYSEAGSYITKLRDKLGHREYFTAELYMKLDAPRSALIYFDEVIDKFQDTQYYEQAWIGKIEALNLMKRYDEAISLIDLYLKKFPDGAYVADVKALKSQIESTIQELKSNLNE